MGLKFILKIIILQEAMFLFTYAGLYLYAGSMMIKHYKGGNNDHGKAMGSMAICAGAIMGVDFVSAFIQIYR